MTAALFKVTIKTSVAEAGGDTVEVPLTLTGNLYEKANIDVPLNSTVNVSTPFPLGGVNFISMACSGANLTVTTNHETDETTTTINLVKGQPLMYYPGGTIADPFTKGVKTMSLHNADLAKPAVFHLRILRDATVIDWDDD
jgi:hypothetical protein